MRCFVVVILFLFSASVCCGQTTDTLTKDTASNKKAPLYILKLSKHRAKFISSLNGILPADIASIRVYKEGAEKLYGDKAKYGVIELKLKKGTRLISYTQLLKIYHLQNADTLPVFIDSALVLHPKTTCFEQAAIKWVEIDTEAGTGMRYISVRTVFIIHHPNKGEIYIRGLAAIQNNN